MTESSAQSVPQFVVVGHVNRGKSSIVSTLAVDENVRISPEPGTTIRNQHFPLTVRGQVLYTLIDTPGFERARHCLQWLNDHTADTADRAAAIARFVNEHRKSGEFPQECELLTPILDGAAILYVVDGSMPFSEQYESEMEILRRTMQPRMALINCTTEADYTAEWRNVLDQYFSIVRPFNSHRAQFEERINLLRAIRELRDNWREPMDRAIAALVDDRKRLTEDAAAAISTMLCDMLTFVLEKKLDEEAEPNAIRKPLTEKYYSQLRKLEASCREDLRSIYQLDLLEVQEDAIGVANEDLFDVDTWSRLGLSQSQLAMAAAFSGALAGGAIDAMAVGTTGMAGSIVGGVLGGAAGVGATVFGWKHLEEVKVLGQPMAGQLLRIGPMQSTQFAWVALDRAWIYQTHLAHRAHADRSAATLQYDESKGIVRTLESKTRRRIETLFTKLRKKQKAVRHTIEQELATELAKLFDTSL